MSWKTNSIMTWNGTLVTDHGRQPLSENTERIGTDTRMADGTLRRQHIGVKRSWSVNWENLPAAATIVGMNIADGQAAGAWIENFYFTTPGKFRMVLRRGSAKGKATPNPAESALPYKTNDFYIVNVMMTEFSKEVVKRGNVDMWNVSVTLEEV